MPQKPLVRLVNLSDFNSIVYGLVMGTENHSCPLKKSRAHPNRLASPLRNQPVWVLLVVKHQELLLPGDDGHAVLVVFGERLHFGSFVVYGDA